MSYMAFKQLKNKFAGKDVKEVLRLAVPAMTENILQVMLGIVDTIFISRIGIEAIAGVGATNVLMNIYIALFTALGVGTTAVVSRSIGAKKKQEANIATEQSTILAVIIGLVLGFITLIFAKNVLQVMGAEERVITFALPYFKLVAVPSVFLALMLVLSSALRGAGDTRTPMKVTLLINIINVVLDYVLIFGLFNFNGLGIVGAGLATTIARIIGVVLLLGYIIKKKDPLVLSIKRFLRINFTMIKKVIMIGYPATIERLLMRMGQLVYATMIIKIGTEAYAAHNIAGSIESLSYMPAYGFAIAASTLVGQNLGANQPEQAEHFGLLSNRLGTVFMIGVGILFFIFARPLGLLFTNNEVVLQQVVTVLRIIALVQPALCITQVITAALQGAGDTKFPMYSTLIGIWGIRVLGIYFLGLVLKLGLIGVWISVAADLVLRGILLMLRFRKGRWKTIKI